MVTIAITLILKEIIIIIQLRLQLPKISIKLLFLMQCSGLFAVFYGE